MMMMMVIKINYKKIKAYKKKRRRRRRRKLRSKCKIVVIIDIRNSWRRIQTTVRISIENKGQGIPLMEDLIMYNNNKMMIKIMRL